MRDALMPGERAGFFQRTRLNVRLLCGRSAPEAAGAPRRGLPWGMEPGRAALAASATAAQRVRVDGREVRLTNLGKPFWPSLGLTKGDLLRYYVDVAPFLLPHL